MSLQDNKVFVSSRNQKITRFVMGPSQDPDNLQVTNPKELVDEVLSQEGWEMPRRTFHTYGSFNDQVWQQAISSLRTIDENRHRRDMYDDEHVLFQLIERGIVDFPSSNDVAVGSIIRYMAVVGERLWSLLERQQAMIDQVERQFYKAISDNRVLSEKIVRLEVKLDKMKNVNSPGMDDHQLSPSMVERFNCLVGSLIEAAVESKEADSSADTPKLKAPVEDPVVPQSGWVGPFVDVPLASLEGRKRRQRERLQRAQEAKASKHSVTPPVDAILESVVVVPSEQAIASLRNIDENRRRRDMYDDESVLFQLIERGLIDFPSSDDVAIGSIVRYTAVVGERLWSLLESQQVMFDQLERQLYRASSDNCVLSEKIIRLEARLDKMKGVSCPPGLNDQCSPLAIERFSSLVGSMINAVIESKGTDSSTGTPKLDVPSVLEDPVVPRSAWIGPFVDVPLASLEGRKRRWRERLQCAQEAKASKHPVTPPVDVVLESVVVVPSEAATTSFPEQD
ncbi:hypothetical protein BDM02DRAFT_3193169 [Thelephora ganbajun]|uniref:Uncharacterized protein n=1 Tax=Thelephora ganbajun TaxID=370292 RepID=A0ACB6YYV4_THEGA|nr:hypothetical protein BDM02DRAFT_3193169 [Thelephora ganbajun]